MRNYDTVNIAEELGFFLEAEKTYGFTGTASDINISSTHDGDSWTLEITSNVLQTTFIRPPVSTLNIQRPMLGAVNNSEEPLEEEIPIEDPTDIEEEI